MGSIIQTIVVLIIGLGMPVSGLAIGHHLKDHDIDYLKANGVASYVSTNGPEIRRFGIHRIEQSDDDKERQKLLKEYSELKKKVTELSRESSRLFIELEKLKPGTREYREKEEEFGRASAKTNAAIAELAKLKKRVFPCGENQWERILASKLMLILINESKLRVNLYVGDGKYPSLLGIVDPGKDADFRLDSYRADVVKQKGIYTSRFEIRVTATYPDGSGIPATRGVNTRLKTSFGLAFPDKKPCVATKRVLLTNSDFGNTAAIPNQSVYSIYLDRVRYDGRTINNGPRNDLTVYFTGKPKWPVTAYLTATSCPPGVSCPPVKMTFASSSLENENAVIMPKVLYCTGFRRSASIGAEVKLEDSEGNMTLPAAVTTHCIVK